MADVKKVRTKTTAELAARAVSPAMRKHAADEQDRREKAENRHWLATLGLTPNR